MSKLIQMITHNAKMELVNKKISFLLMAYALLALITKSKIPMTSLFVSEELAKVDTN